MPISSARFLTCHSQLALVIKFYAMTKECKAHIERLHKGVTWVTLRCDDVTQAEIHSLAPDDLPAA